MKVRCEYCHSLVDALEKTCPLLRQSAAGGQNTRIFYTNTRARAKEKYRSGAVGCTGTGGPGGRRIGMGERTV